MSFTQFSYNRIQHHKKKIIRYGGFFLMFVVVLVGISYLSGSRISESSLSQAKIQEVLETDFEAQLYFNDNNGKRDFLLGIRDIINNAEHSLDVAMYSFDDRELVRLLEKKHQEGVRVRVVLPANKKHIEKKTFDNVHYEIIEVGQKESGSRYTLEDAFMHHKFILADVGYDTQRVLMGSTNLTHYQQEYDSNFYLTTTDSNVVEVFKKEFALLRQGTFSSAKLRSNRFKPFSYRGDYSNGFFELWLGPGYRENAMKTRLLEVIDTAESNIKVLGWRINDRDIFQALRAKALSGVEVTVLVGDFYMWNEQSVTSQRNNWPDTMNVLSDSFTSLLYHQNGTFKASKIILAQKFNSFLHHHTLIVDDTILVTGSNNWSYRGFFYNDELSLVTDVPDLVQDYIDEFNFLMQRNQGQLLDIQKTSIGNEFVINTVFEPEETILVFVEQSSPEWEGQICQEIDVNTVTVGKVTIKPECVTDTTRIFVIDSEYNLRASAYIPQ